MIDLCFPQFLAPRLTNGEITALLPKSCALCSIRRPVPTADSGVGARAGGSGDPSVGGGGDMLVGPSTNWDSASDVGEPS